MLDFGKELSNFDRIKELDDIESDIESTCMKDFKDFMTDIWNLLNLIYTKIKG